MQPGLTYKIDNNTGHISSMIDKQQAITQSISKILLTQKYTYDIYGWAYGLDMELFVGEELEYIQLQLPTYIKESLMKDDRIISVDNIVITAQTIDSCLITLDVTTTEGSITGIEQEINYGR